MPFQIIRNDITKVKADAIVNTANPKPQIGHGTDSAVYEAAGREELLAARQQIGRIDRGQAAYTEAFQLDAKYIIHTVGPVWKDGLSGERAILHSCYETSLELADRLKCRSIAFPLVSSGAYGFPKEEALTIAIDAIRKFLQTHDMKVILVVFDRTALELSESLVGDIEQFIDEQAARKIREKEYGGRAFSSVLEYRALRRRRGKDRRDGSGLTAGIPENRDRSLEDMISDAGETFQQKLFKLIDESGMDDVTVYKKANIERRSLSRRAISLT